LVGQSQGNIALGEVSAKPPRSDILPNLANALGVKIEDLFFSDSVKKSGHSKHSSPKAGPTGKLRKLFLQPSFLPRFQLDKFCDFLSFFLLHFHRRMKKYISKFNSLPYCI